MKIFGYCISRAIFLILKLLVRISVEVVTINGRMRWHILGSEVAGYSKFLLAPDWTSQITFYDFCACCRGLMARVESIINRLILVYSY